LDDVRYQHAPEVHMLNALLSNSKTVPKWLGDRESPEYKHYKDGTHGPFVSEIAEAIGSNFQISDDDPALNKEVGQCLQPLLSICASAYRNERQLRLSKPESAAPIILDSSVFFTIGLDQYSALGQRVVESCTAPHGNDINAAENILHWVMEYKPDLGLEKAHQQVYEGLTTALYQRRALGFTDQFVFGACHYDQIYLEVVAAIWISPNDTDNKADPARTPIKADNPLPVTPIWKNLDKWIDVDDAPGLHRVEGTHNQGKQQIDDAKLIRDLDQRNKIAVYRLGTYCMQDVDSIIAFYLLMRGARALAMEYREAITTSSVARMKVIKTTNSQLFDW
ncbi:unnamed protein product, partial [Rhizoctonia solani]